MLYYEIYVIAMEVFAYIPVEVYMMHAQEEENL